MTTVTETRERPILFSGEMVRAILAGRKTQTRRVVKLRDPSATYSTHDDEGWPVSADECGDWIRDPCPFGAPGDRLWVRETHCVVRGTRDPTGRDDDCVFYRADESSCFFDPYKNRMNERSDFFDQCMIDVEGGWKPSIHMPRWACRLELEVTGVRVERLQDISDGDAKAEGIKCRTEHLPGGWCRTEPVEEFQQLWDSINGKRDGCDWSSNPWVWVVEFQQAD